MTGRPRLHGLALVGVLLLAALLRIHEAAQDRRFHPDEALYATFARDAVAYGDWFFPGALDKPPLYPYAAAVAMHFTAAQRTDAGVIDVPVVQGEFAARLPNIFAGIVAVGLVYALALALDSRRTPALIAAVVAAVSPQMVGFSASAFTDMLMLALILGGMLAAVRGFPAWSGLLLAASVMVKPQGTLFLPLVVIFVLRLHIDPIYRHGYVNASKRRAALGRFVVAFGTGVALLLVWDVLRPGESLFSVGARHIVPDRAVVTVAEIPARLETWLRYAAWLLGPPWLTALLAGFATVQALVRRHRVNGLLLAFGVGYTALHVVQALPVYDRYVLPLAPLLAILVGRGCNEISPLVRARHVMPLHPCLLIVLIAVVVAASTPYDAGQHGRRDGDLLALAAYLNEREFGAILYDHYVGWELDYYLGAWSDKRRVYYPSPAHLAQNAPRNPETVARYWVAPGDVDSAPWLDALRMAGFAVAPVYERAGFVVYRALPH